MGIKHLKTLLNCLCQGTGILNFSTVTDFIQSEKMRLYREEIFNKGITNPIKKMIMRKDVDKKTYLLAVDACLYAVRYKRVFKRIEYGFLRQIILSLSIGIIPVYIFDGAAPEQKKKTISVRQTKKSKIREKITEIFFPDEINKLEYVSELPSSELVEYINKSYQFTAEQTSNYLLYNPEEKSDKYKEFVRLMRKSACIENGDIQNLKKFLDMLNIPYLTAKKEADDLMASLYRKGIIHGCLSDDMDMLPKGCGNLIHISNKGTTQYLLSDILRITKLNYEQFVDLCILLGSDYCDSNLSKINPMEIYSIFKSLDNPSIENFINEFSTKDPTISEHLEEYIKVRNLFLDIDDSEFKPLKIKLTPLVYDPIIEYLNSIGINLGHNDSCKIKAMLKQANMFIQSLSSLSSQVRFA